jgi:cytoskeleton protein RodZ
VEHSVTEQAEQAGGAAQALPIGTAEQLAAAREQRGISKAEVAQRLKLAPRQLDAIERGDWAALPGRAFARGSVRSYGKLLGVDIEPLLKAIGGFAEPEDLRPSASLDAPMPRPGSFGFDGEGRGNLLPWAILGVIGVIALALFFGREGDVSSVGSWIGKGTAPGSSSATGGPAPAGTAAGGATPGPMLSGTGSDSTSGTTLVPAPLAAPGAATPAASGTSAAAAGAAAPAAGAAGGTVAGSAGAGVPAAAGAVGGAAAAGAAATGTPGGSGAPIRLTVSQDVWVEVKQGDGKAIYTGTVKPGTPAEFRGTPPFSLVLGNANQARLEFEGKPVEIKPGPNNIARVKLP